jgi:hypothetical protein
MLGTNNELDALLIDHPEYRELTKTFPYPTGLRWEHVIKFFNENKKVQFEQFDPEQLMGLHRYQSLLFNLCLLWGIELPHHFQEMWEGKRPIIKT